MFFEKVLEWFFRIFGEESEWDRISREHREKTKHKKK